MSHKGKATSDVSFNPDDPPVAYTSSTAYEKMMAYTEASRSIRGLEYDPWTDNIDAETVMRIGQGKKHGRFWISDSVIDTASTPTLSPGSEHGPQAAPHSRRYARGLALHSTGSKYLRLFLWHSSYIDHYTTLFPLQYCIISFAPICRPMWKKQTGGPPSWRWSWRPSEQRGKPRTKGLQKLSPGCNLRRVPHASRVNGSTDAS
jgi:hypothetical protein